MKEFGRALIVLLLAISHFIMHNTVWANVLFLCIIFSLSIVAIIAFLINKKSFKISIPEILFSIFSIYIFIFNVINGSFVGNERLYMFLILLMLYLAYSVLYKRDTSILEYITYGLFIGFAIELVIGFGQLFGLFSNSDSLFILGGLFGNPGAFAGYLTIISLFFFTVLLFHKQLSFSENFQFIIISSISSALCLIILSDSRGAWLALFTGILFILNIRYHLILQVNRHLKTTISKVFTGLIILFLVTFISFALYQYKKESAFGRLFIWKTSSEMIHDKPIFGMGFGSFKANYGKVQAAYFLNGEYTVNEKMIADYVTCAYNEFIELLIESGITGLLLFLSILFFALAKKYNKESSVYNIAAKAFLLSLIVLSMVSYPFRLMPDLLLLTICLFIIFRTGKYKTITIPVRLSKLLVLIWLATVSCLVYNSSRYITGEYFYQMGYKKVLNNNLDDGIKDYKKAYKFLNNNSSFLFFYGSALYLKHNYSGSIQYLKKATVLSSNPNAYITLGNSLQKLKRYAEAEKAYKIASGITPAKLYPKYLLAKLYIEMQQNEKAMDMAKIVISSKIKVPTTAGVEIKEEMRKLILHINNFHTGQ